MVAVLIFAGLLVLAAVGAFVWTAVRSGVRQAVENARRADVTAAPVAHWTADLDAPVTYWPTYTDPRAADRAASVHIGYPVDEPVYGSAADDLRDELRRRSY